MSVLALLIAASDTAQEGKQVIVGMLIVGLVFCSVVAIGNGLRRLTHRRRELH
jgi:hypothetical protein